VNLLDLNHKTGKKVFLISLYLWYDIKKNSYTLPCAGIRLATSLVIGADFIGRCKSNYRTITVMTALIQIQFLLNGKFKNFYQCLTHLLIISVV
jgi:hypothetical protein